MSTLKNLFIFLLYLTPLGPILSVTSIITDNEHRYFGVTIVFPKNSSESLTVIRPENPTAQMRVRWFASGTGILLQTFALIQIAITRSQIQAPSRVLLFFVA